MYNEIQINQARGALLSFIRIDPEASVDRRAAYIEEKGIRYVWMYVSRSEKNTEPTTNAPFLRDVPPRRIGY